MSPLRYWWMRLTGQPLSCKVRIFQTCSWHGDTFSDRPFWVVQSLPDGETRNFGVSMCWEKVWWGWKRIR